MNITDVSLNFLNTSEWRPKRFRKYSFQNPNIASLVMSSVKESFRKSPTSITCTYVSSYFHNFCLKCRVKYLRKNIDEYIRHSNNRRGKIISFVTEAFEKRKNTLSLTVIPISKKEPFLLRPFSFLSFYSGGWIFLKLFSNSLS